MDTVKALNSYRKSITGDESAFEVLCLLYRTASATEQDLRSWTGIKKPTLKAKLRELYQADLLKAGSGESFFLTPLAETVLSELEVDRLVISVLVNEITSKAEADRFSHFTDWVWRTEPERRKSTVHHLRNLRKFLDTQEFGSDDRTYLLWLCAVQPDSRVRLILKNELTSVNAALIDDSRNHLWADAVQSANQAAALLDQMDTVLAHACTDAIPQQSLTDKLMNVLTFRYINYAFSPERDHVLETYHSQFSSAGRDSLQATMSAKFPFLERVVEIFTHQSQQQGSHIKESFFSLVDRVLSTKIRAQFDISFSLNRLTNPDVRAAVQLPKIGSGSKASFKKRYRRKALNKLAKKKRPSRT